MKQLLPHVARHPLMGMLRILPSTALSIAIHDRMQILSNGFTIGCITAIALHLVLPVSLPTL